MNRTLNLLLKAVPGVSDLDVESRSGMILFSLDGIRFGVETTMSVYRIISEDAEFKDDASRRIEQLLRNAT